MRQDRGLEIRSRVMMANLPSVMGNEGVETWVGGVRGGLENERGVSRFVFDGKDLPSIHRI